MGHVDATIYQHPLDQQTLAALEAVPVFPAFMKVMMKFFSERIWSMDFASSSIELSERQLPGIYDKLPPICEKLGIDVPRLYLSGSREVNAMTVNESSPLIMLNAGSLECCSDDEITALLAHECGHIACHHVLYRQTAKMLLTGAISLVPGVGPLVSLALQYAFYSWYRASEYSADRAAAIAMGGSKAPIDLMATFAGDLEGLDLGIDKNLFLEQALDYEQTIAGSTTNQVFEMWVFGLNSHPLTAYRALELARYCESPDFQYTQDIIHDRIAPAPAPQDAIASAMPADMPPVQDEAPGAPEPMRFCMNCGTPVNPGDAFCANCGSPVA